MIVLVYAFGFIKIVIPFKRISIHNDTDPLGIRKSNVMQQIQYTGDQNIMKSTAYFKVHQIIEMQYNLRR